MQRVKLKYGIEEGQMFATRAASICVDIKILNRIDLILLPFHFYIVNTDLSKKLHCFYEVNKQKLISKNMHKMCCAWYNFYLDHTRSCMEIF